MEDKREIKLKAGTDNCKQTVLQTSFNKNHHVLKTFVIFSNLNHSKQNGLKIKKSKYCSILHQVS